MWVVDFYLSGTSVSERLQINLQRPPDIGTLEGVKPWHYILLIGVGTLGSVYIYLHRVEFGLARLPTPVTYTSAESVAPSSQPTPINWEKVDRSAQGFQVEMPTDIKELQIPAYNESGGSEQVNMIFSHADAETSFAVAWADDPPVARANQRSPAKLLDMAQDDAMARTQTSLTGENRNDFDGFPARDFSARNAGGGILNSRLIYATPRLYMLIAAFPSENARREEDVRRFFNSFAVVSR
jgi:hypothetical protein